MSLCCNAHQIDIIVAVCAYTVLILGTWRVDAVRSPTPSSARSSVRYARRGAGASCGSSSRWGSGRAVFAFLCCTLAGTLIYEVLASTAWAFNFVSIHHSNPRVCRHASSICRRQTRREARRAALIDRRHRLQHAAIDSAAVGSRRHRCGCRHPHHNRCEGSSSSPSSQAHAAKQRSGPAASAS